MYTYLHYIPTPPLPNELFKPMKQSPWNSMEQLDHLITNP